MPSATLTTKGQITVPKVVRQKLRLRPGDRLAFRERADGTFSIEPERGDLLALAGTLKPRRKGVTLDQMDRAIVRGALGK